MFWGVETKFQVPSFQVSREGGREGGPMRGLGTDHVISGQMRGLEKNCIPWRRQTDTQMDIATL